MAFYQGSEGPDSLTGDWEDDAFFGGDGDDTIEGGAGNDTALLRGYFSDYVITYDAASHTYTLVDQYAGRDGTDVVHAVENFAFADGIRTWGQLVPHMGDGVELTGSEGGEWLPGGSGFDTLSGLGGNDFLDGQGADDRLDCGDGDDGLSGGDGDDIIEGGAGNDTALLRGYFSDYVITYDSATHTYTLVDQYAGRDGTDVVHAVENFAFADGMRTWGQLVPHVGDGIELTGSEGGEWLPGGSGFDTLSGLGGNDFLDGQGADDRLDGGDGDDGLSGGDGDDTIEGGAGNDTALLRGYFSDYVITYDAASHTYTLVDQYAGRDGADTVHAVENFAFADGMRTWGQLVPHVGDGIELTGSEAGEWLPGGSGFDTLAGLGGNDFLDGQGADDRLDGGDGDDGLSGGDGDDTIEGGAGNDTALLRGYFSDYVITYDAASHTYTLVDQYAGRDGTDTVHAVENFAFADGMRTWGQLVPHVGDGIELTGSEGGEWLPGGSGFDTIWGLAGSDFLDGQGADDRLDGGDGDDGLSGGDGDDIIEGGAGNDTALLRGYFSDYVIMYDAASHTYTLVDQYAGRDGTDVVHAVENFAFADGMRTWGQLVPHMGDGVELTGSEGGEWLPGGSGFDTLSGLGGNDFLDGQGADDRLDGGDGDDGLSGGDGDDLIEGGAGNDTALLRGYFSDYVITYDGATQTVTLADQYLGRDGTDSVQGVESFAFADGMKTLDDLLMGVPQP
jgi:Ca2+-binding RTX toxin-like protein